MGDILSKELRERAAHCRKLAGSMTDDATRQNLLVMAKELDDHADELEAVNRPQIPPEPI